MYYKVYFFLFFGFILFFIFWVMLALFAFETCFYSIFFFRLFMVNHIIIISSAIAGAFHYEKWRNMWCQKSDYITSRHKVKSSSRHIVVCGVSKKLSWLYINSITSPDNPLTFLHARNHATLWNFTIYEVPTY